MFSLILWVTNNSFTRVVMPYNFLSISNLGFHTADLAQLGRNESTL